MIPGFEAVLRHPRTGVRLRLGDAEIGDHGRVRTGTLTSEEGTDTFPIRDYVPIFAGEDSYAGSFGKQWTRWTAERVLEAPAGVDLADHYRRKFRTITGFDEMTDDGDLVVEVGSGSGMFTAAVRETGARYIGLDLSQAVFAAQANHLGDAGVQFVKADALSPPLAAGSADAAFSIGVFHHTPDPELATTTMLSLVRSGGHFSVSVYADDGYHGQAGVRRLRAVFAGLDPEDAESLASGYAIVASKLLHPVFGVLMQDPRRREALLRLQQGLAPSFNDESAVWRATVLYDAITPVYASTHSPAEVERWLRSGGAASVEPRTWPSVAFAGRVA